MTALRRTLLVVAIGAACLSAACAAAGERHGVSSGGGCACPAALCDAGQAEQGGGSDKARMGLLFFVFVLAIFLGVELISKVPSQLHTPLMSGSNAISGISIVGALVAAGTGKGPAMIVLGTLAVALAMVNVVGGYLVTDRMLGMFKHKD